VSKILAFEERQIDSTSVADPSSRRCSAGRRRELRGVQVHGDQPATVCIIDGVMRIELEDWG
jgi:hypothetical protein